MPKGKRIQVKFLDFGFSLSLTCPGDFLKVYDGGGSSDDAVSEKYYAYERRLPAAFNSSRRYLYVNF